MGRAVAATAVLLDLRLAVVAGSVALGFGPPFFAAAQAEIDRAAAIAYARGTRILPAAAGGLRGLGHDVLATAAPGRVPSATEG